MNTGKIITRLREERSWSQSDLANKSSVSRVMIGKYERDEAIPSIEAAKKIADSFGVSLDYLVGEGQNAQFDKKTLERLEYIEKMDGDTKDKLYFVIDTFIRDFRTRQAYS